MSSTIWTIGHSTRPLDAFLELLARNRLEAVAMCAASWLAALPSVRGSGAPWCARPAWHRLSLATRARRPARPLPGSPNVAWRSASFRGYADHMSSAEFSVALLDLLDFAARLRTT
jgi:hypothetical protein